MITSLETKIADGLDALSNEYEELSFRPAGPSRVLRAAVSVGTCAVLAGALWAGVLNRHDSRAIVTGTSIAQSEMPIDLNQTVGDFYREPFSSALGFETTAIGEHSNQIGNYFSTFNEIQINECLAQLTDHPHIANWSRNGKPANHGPTRLANLTLANFRAQYGVAAYIFPDGNGDTEPPDTTAIYALDPRVLACSKDLPDSEYRADLVAVNRAFSRAMLDLKASGRQAQIDRRFAACTRGHGLTDIHSPSDAINKIEDARGSMSDAEQTRSQDLSRHYAKLAGDCFNEWEAAWTAAMRPLEQAYVDANPDVFTRLRAFMASIDDPTTIATNDPT
jgi:hypothetical protein